MYTRRDIGKFALGTTALSALPVSLAFGADNAVRLGATTWSLRDLTRVPGEDNVIDLVKPLKSAGVTEIDLWSYNVEPAGPNFGPGAPPPPAHNGKAYWIKVSAKADGSFTVTNARNGFSKTYEAKTR